MKEKSTKVLNSISELHDMLILGRPAHQLISIIDVRDVDIGRNKLRAYRTI